jgi:quercetin dioxygenase-like cupin family protein
MSAGTQTPDTRLLGVAAAPACRCGSPTAGRTSSDRSEPFGSDEAATASRTCSAMSSALPASEPAATWSAAGQGERLWFLGTLAIVRVPGEAVDGRFALIEFLFPRHASPPLHTHPQDESYTVLDGRLTVQAGADRFALHAGGIAVVPAAVAHTFRVESDTAHVLVLSTPAGLERLVRDASVPATSPTLPPADTPRPTPERLEQIFRTHRQVNLGPALATGDPARDATILPRHGQRRAARPAPPV